MQRRAQRAGTETAGAPGCRTGRSRRWLISAGLVAGAAAGWPRALWAQTLVATPVADADGNLALSFLDLPLTVAADPQRVAVMEGWGDLEFAVIAGYPIVASGNSFWPDEPVGSRLGGAMTTEIPVLSNDWESIDLEEITALQPDLIVMRGNAYSADWYGNELLAGIAPILAVEVNRPTWRDDLTAQLALLGRTAEATPYLNADDERLVTAQAEAAPLFAGKQVYFITAVTEDIPIWTDGFAIAVATKLGMEVPMVTNPELSAILVSPEQLNQLAEADWIFRQITDERWAADMDELATWQAVPAVRAGKVWDFSPQFNNGLAIQTRLLLDELVAASQSLSARA